MENKVVKIEDIKTKGSLCDVTEVICYELASKLYRLDNKKNIGKIVNDLYWDLTEQYQMYPNSAWYNIEKGNVIPESNVLDFYRWVNLSPYIVFQYFLHDLQEGLYFKRGVSFHRFDTLDEVKDYIGYMGTMLGNTANPFSFVVITDKLDIVDLGTWEEKGKYGYPESLEMVNAIKWCGILEDDNRWEDLVENNAILLKYKSKKQRFNMNIKLGKHITRTGRTIRYLR